MATTKQSTTEEVKLTTKDRVEMQVKSIGKRAKSESIPFPKDLKEKLLSSETKGEVKRKWKQYLVNLVRDGE